MQYSELHCITNFTFLRGASHPHELVTMASNLGYRALAITDECSLAGVVKAHVATFNRNIKLIIGSEFKIDSHKVIVLVTNRNSYSKLSSLITLARRRSKKGSYQIKWSDLKFNNDGLLIIWLPCGDFKKDQLIISQLHDWFERRLWIGFHNLLNGTETSHLSYLQKLSLLWKVNVVACGDVHMHKKDRQPLQDVLTAIKQKCSIMELGKSRYPNSERYLRKIEYLKNIYPEELMRETINISNLCNFSLNELRYEYPIEVVPKNLTSKEYLSFLVHQGAKKRWPSRIPKKILSQINHELNIIYELNYETYFLTVYDIVSFAHQNNIFCQGRGSAANSVVCYCLFITEVSPEQISLLFERFISKERNEPPDIDIDFEHERREEVIQYIYKRYTRERAALAATVITYKPRSAIKDVGKALGLDINFIESISQSLAWWDRKKDLERKFTEFNSNENLSFKNSNLIQHFYYLMQQILGFPRHLSQHVGGFIITRGPTSEIVPIENATMTNRTVIQWDKEDIESLGLLKIDILALGMLTAIHRCIDLVKNNYSKDISIQKIPKNDDATYSMLCNADSIGVFQVESRAQMTMLPRLKPRSFYDLVIEIAIVRPGPIQGGMVHPYLRRRQGLEEVSYPDKKIKEVLECTLGIPVFQEQVIRLAMVAAGFSGGEADQLRRAMASWSNKYNSKNQLALFEEKLTEGMLKNGYNLNFAKNLFKQIQGFGVYGFPESHSASFALLAYASAWLKCHYPAAFYCSLMNSQPMGFYSISQLTQDAKRHDIEVRPIDVNYSSWEHTLEKSSEYSLSRKYNFSIRLGFRIIKGLSKMDSLKIKNCNQKFENINDFHNKTNLSKAKLSLLSSAGALDSINKDRRITQWHSLSLKKDQLSLCNKTDEVNLPSLNLIDKMWGDYDLTGLTLGEHPMSLFRKYIGLFKNCKRNCDLSHLNHKQEILIAGIVTGRQRPGTASGVIFITLEDETGNSNVVVWKNIQERFREALLKSQFLLVQGVLEKEGDVVHIIANQLKNLNNEVRKLNVRARNFK